MEKETNIEKDSWTRVVIVYVIYFIGMVALALISYHIIDG
jgi:hypothetical protein